MEVRHSTIFSSFNLQSLRPLGDYAKKNKLIAAVACAVFAVGAYCVVRMLKTQPLQSNLGIGTVYEITNSLGTKSYLIGTFHQGDEDMIKKSYFHRILDTCSRLYTENGPNDLLFPHSFPKHKEIQYLFSLDLAIAQAAQRRKIAMYSLDAGIPKIDQEWEHFYKILATTPNRAALVDGMEQGWVLNAKKRIELPNFLEMYHAVKEGNVALLESFRHRLKDKDAREARESHWRKILIPELLATQKSICIAVGVAHVVGEKGLSGKFREAGLTVRLIPAV